MKILYTAFVRPHFEYAIQFWSSPNYNKDQNLSERAQRRATKLIPTLRNLSYEERLKQLNMFTLHKRRVTGDMIEVFKILNKFDKINPEVVLFETKNALITRSNSMKLKVQKYNTITRKSYFNVRVVDHWNRLPASIVNSKTNFLRITTCSPRDSSASREVAPPLTFFFYHRLGTTLWMLAVPPW